MADQDFHVPERVTLNVDEDGNPITVWKIAIRDDIRAFMVTDPDPYWAKDVAERDWYLEKQLKRPREDYVVEEVPGPIDRAIRDENIRFELARIQLRTERGRS
ncbi:hypothetical protein [Amycolatopsis kentuckyensis]|uniref:hypothetical protein n=1 Tax=Amycolatopsis kentuckyensis TaxID=218823 RepID=UPI000A35E244|nr:hypothetical protein [Amycolatopsis kentuckyensis]